MNAVQLLKWQWDGYPRYHTSKADLLLHIVAVPIFDLGTLSFLLGVIRFSPMLAIAGVAGMLVSVIAQGRGHRWERVPPEPFTGPGNFIGRLWLEQWVNFPRFVLTGKWWRNYRGV